MSTITLHCPCCGEAVPVSREAIEAALHATRSEAVEVLAGKWRAWCRESGRHITPDDRVTPEVTAELVGLTVGTLKNRRSQGLRPHFVRVGNRLVKYTLQELADWITAREA